jgi:hypothetical protein
MPATNESTAPLDFAGVLAAALDRGGTFYGRPLVTVSFAWEGGEFRSTLEPPMEAEAEEPVSSEQKRKILEALQRSEVPLTRKQLARCVGLKNARGRFGTTVSAMVKDGDISEREGMLTDDASKHLEE